MNKWPEFFTNETLCSVSSIRYRKQFLINLALSIKMMKENIVFG